MIDEKKLIEELKHNDLEFMQQADLMDCLGDIVNRQPKIDKWIPCSERLPEDDKYILLSFKNFTIPVVGRYEEDDNGGAFYVGDDMETCISNNLIVNAWQPLPEPYKSSDSQK